MLNFSAFSWGDGMGGKRIWGLMAWVVCLAVMLGGCANDGSVVGGGSGNQVHGGGKEKKAAMTRLWRSGIPYGWPDCRPVVRNGFVYLGVGVNDSCIKKLDVMTGKEMWSEDGMINQGAGVEVYGTVVVYGVGALLKAREDATGREAWETRLNGTVFGTTPGPEGVLFAVTDGGEVAAVQAADGRVKWRVKVGGEIGCLPVVFEDQLAVVAKAGVLHVLSVKDGAEAWKLELGGTVKTDAVSYQNRLLVGVGEGWDPMYAKTMLSVSMDEKKADCRWDAIYGWRQEVVVDEDYAYLCDMFGLRVVKPYLGGVTWEYPDESNHLGNPVLVGEQVLMPFKSEDDQNNTEHVVAVARKEGGLIAWRKEGAIPMGFAGAQYGRWKDVMVVVSGGKVEAWQFAPMGMEMPAGEVDLDGGPVWSETVRGLQGRVAMRERGMEEGTPVVDLYVVLRASGAEIDFEYSRAWMSLCVVDGEGREISQPGGSSGSGPVVERKDIHLPYASELWLAYGGWDWREEDGILNRLEDGKEYYLRVTLGVARKDLQNEFSPWNGRLEFPLMKMPKRPPAMTEKQATALIEKYGPPLLSNDQTLGRHAMEKLSYIKGNDPRLTRLYVKAMDVKGDSSLVGQVINKLAEDPSDEAVEGLKQGMGFSSANYGISGDGLRSWTALSLAKNKNPKAKELLWMMRGDAYASVRLRVLQGLAVKGEPRGREVCLLMMADKDEGIRGEAKRLLAEVESGIGK
jgi:hypothetical protein